MAVFEVIGTGLLAALTALLLVFARREIISRRGGTIDMNLRLSTFVPGRGWSPGLGRFTDEELRWYRLFSFGVRPRRVLTRQGLVVEGRRPPAGEERVAMPRGWVVVRCRGRGSPVEIALAESALMGLLSWLESAPPGALRRS
jgi:hypothetical protein